MDMTMAYLRWQLRKAIEAGEWLIAAHLRDEIKKKSK